MYIGALSVLLAMDQDLIIGVISDQYKGKEKLLKSNINALQLGADWAKKNLQYPIGLQAWSPEQAGTARGLSPPPQARGFP